MPPRVALLLAAGEARRLGGRKPLVPVAGRPLA
ncbi:MAG: NTP transferase domain-containing protein, partial [Crenarchaeota archaeon]|nr:NTP transferase domain-containing protein [Thermoproteota archaeon]